ncbi:hypothetical protein [Wenxinia saemankumensis]|uniref:Uncharacterized protein n=1 Tax=Wenxinia saemankumensis TaxID=1447782 RepID=A0A1M6BUT8_9RHOB|nr:hypothetical protein [Wenxinia saemankumensis]SHI52499.1 hypothetical protein SAMN05444417_0860 [Wenxinia saemankumensis]
MSTSDDIKKTADDIGDKAKATAHDVVDAAKRTGREAVDSATAEATRRGNEAKSATAGEIRTVAEALRKAADDLQDGSYQEKTFGYLANNLADMSDRVESKDIGEIVEDLTYYARRNPVLFLGGAALLGFAVTRFGKATSRSTPYEAGYGTDRPATAQPQQTPGFASASPAGSPAAATTRGGAVHAPRTQV